jgi:hypothetical protein
VCIEKIASNPKRQQQIAQERTAQNREGMHITPSKKVERGKKKEQGKAHIEINQTTKTK